MVDSQPILPTLLWLCNSKRQILLIGTACTQLLLFAGTLANYPQFAATVRRLEAFQKQYRLFGARIAARNAFLWLLRRIFIYKLLNIYAASTTTLASLEHDEDLTFGFEKVETVPAELLQQAGIDPKKETLFAGRKAGRLCFISSVEREEFTILNRHRVAVPTRAIYVGCCFTLPEFRGRGIYGQALAALGRHALGHGLHSVYLGIEVENESSIRGVLKVGFRPVACSSVFGLGRFLSKQWKLQEGHETMTVLDDTPDERSDSS